MLKNLNSVKTAYTHAGVFHADDVFASALLTLVNNKICIKRILEVKPEYDTEDTIIFDIGKGEYDHHQNDKALRPFEDGYYTDKMTGEVKQIPYCSFGLLWRDYGRLLCPTTKAWKKVDQTLVLPIDKADNGVAGSTLASAIGQFNPSWNDDRDPESMFDVATIIAIRTLEEYVRRANAEVVAEAQVKSSEVIDGKILVLDKYVPWQDIVITEMPEITYVVFPSNRGGFNVQTVPIEQGSFQARKGFPKEWLGNPDPTLGMTFCHPGNFILSCNELNQAIECAKIALTK